MNWISHRTKSWSSCISSPITVLANTRAKTHPPIKKKNPSFIGTCQTLSTWLSTHRSTYKNLLTLRFYLHWVSIWEILKIPLLIQAIWKKKKERVLQAQRAAQDQSDVSMVKICGHESSTKISAENGTNQMKT